MSRTLRKIIIAEDDRDDQFLVRRAFAEIDLEGVLQFVNDGEELIEVLRDWVRQRNTRAEPYPLVILDLNLPRVDGRAALREIRRDPELRQVPVVVLTTSTADIDIRDTYELGISSFIAKPVTYQQLLNAVRALADYWLQLVIMPSTGGVVRAVGSSGTA